MKAVVMAGGKGTRLRPLTSNRPKPMIPIVNEPCMEHIVRLLERHGITDVLVTLEYMPEVIRGYFGDGSGWGVKLRYSVEDEPRGTAGSVKLAAEGLSERFIVVSGDALTDADLTGAIKFHEERGAEVTLVLKKVEDPSGFGIVVTEEDGRVTDFLEKPDPAEVFSHTANTGIYVLEPGVLAEIPEGQEYDFSDDLFPKLLEGGRAVYGYVMEGYWEDIGDLDQYMGAQRAVLDGEVGGIEPSGERRGEGVYVGRGAEVEDEGLVGPVVIGANARIAPGARIGPYTVVGPGTTVEAGAMVSESTVAEGAFVGEEAEVEGSLVGRECSVGAQARLEEGSALGDGVTVGEGASLAPGVNVYPDAAIESGAQITEDIPRG